jgi:small multidrug resistance pump
LPKQFWPFAVTLAIAAVTVLADGFVKKASLAERPLSEPSLWVGFALYTTTFFPWIYVLRHAKLATIGAWYGVAVVVLLALVGTTLFGERLAARDIVGLVCAVAALLLLGRFA